MDEKQNKDFVPVDGKPNPMRPSALYNGVVYPVMPYSIKGVLWYQGESNSKYPDIYKLLLPDLIRSWRQQWGQGDFPFIFAQLSSYKERPWSLAKNEAWA